MGRPPVGHSLDLHSQRIGERYWPAPPQLPPFTPIWAWRRLLNASDDTREAERHIFAAVLEAWELAHKGRT